MLLTVLQIVSTAEDLSTVVEAALVVRQTASASLSRFPALPRAMLTVSSAAVSGTAAVPGGVVFHALSTRPVTHAHAAPFQAWGLVLPPVTAARLMGPSTGAVVDVALPWAELAGGPEAARLDGDLSRADTDAARLRALQDSLRRVLMRGPQRVASRRAAALDHLCRAVGAGGARAAAPLGVGERQLERRCQALLGLGPKQFQQLTRFHGLLAGALRAQRPPDVQTALAAGYYDQSHLAREARQLAGAPMRELLGEARSDGTWWTLTAQRPPAR